MSTLNIVLSDSVRKAAENLAERSNISVEQFISSAVIEKIMAHKTEQYLSVRAAEGSRKQFGGILDLVPDSEPDEHDKL